MKPMRTATTLTVVLVGLAVLDAPAGDIKPLTPVEAIKKVDEQVTVQMLVKAAKNRLEKRGEIYLDSEENFKDEKNLGIVIIKTGAAKFKEAGVSDPAEHFRDKIIRVKGTVIIKEQRPRIEVDDPKQIQIVKVPDAKDAPPGKDPPKNFTNSIGMKFSWIPPGSFMMGSPKEEKYRRKDETQHKVTLTKGFYMGMYTVTQQEWQAVMGENLNKFIAEKNLPHLTKWEDCQEFIKKLREKDKKPYRLPTEAEWEYCCRAGTTTPFYFGETISTDRANYNGEYSYGNGGKGLSRKKTTPVGSFPANAWGLYDMHGNIWQWCQDFYREYTPKDVADPHGPEKGGLHVLRGGSFKNPPDMCRSAYRFWAGDYTRGNSFIRINHGGFRLCFSVE